VHSEPEPEPGPPGGRGGKIGQRVSAVVTTSVIPRAARCAASAARSARTSAGRTPRAVSVAHASKTFPPGAQTARRGAVRLSPTSPTAIIYDNDVMAVAGAALASGRGLSVPGDLSVVAWEDSVLCRAAHPPLTTLIRDTAAFGRRAARELVDLPGGCPARHAAEPAPRLLVRDSTAPPCG
jgi:DNA-binding LacI/PurR family transcriptional regulator